MSDNFKKLTGKNRNEYETVAKHLVDDCDVELFKELVDNDDFLFDFVSIAQGVHIRVFFFKIAIYALAQLPIFLQRGLIGPQVLLCLFRPKFAD